MEIFNIKIKPFYKKVRHIEIPNWGKHVIFWLILLGVFTSQRAAGVFGYNMSLWLKILSVSVFIPIVPIAYLIVYILIPKFILQKRYWTGYTAIFFSIFFCCICTREMALLSDVKTLADYQPLDSFKSIFINFKIVFTGYYFPNIITCIGTFVSTKLYLDNLKMEQNTLLVEKEKTEIELKTLRSQMNPHFLFNTLNNIYSLSLYQSSKTATSIQKLSGMLDHIIHKCNHKYIPLEEEIKLLDNYIELEKLRYDERLQFSFEKKIESPFLIAPLILLSFVENAFKHGASEDGGSPKIDISILTNQHFFYFYISNTIPVKKGKHHSGSLGLQNISKQLNLLYPKNHSLKINQLSERFTVELKIINQQNA